MKEGFVKLERWTEGSGFKRRGEFILGKEYCYGLVIAEDYITVKSREEIVPYAFNCDVTIGVDIEFELLEDDRVVYAGNRIRGGLEESIGVDGSSRQVEFRPHYSYSPVDILGNLEDLLMEFYDVYDYELGLLGNRYPLGAHVHIGYEFTCSEINRALACIIDYLFGRLLKFSGDARGEYRRRLQWRRQNWGVEYRSFPSYIFRDRILIEYILNVIFKACRDFINQGYVNIESPSRYIKSILGKDTYKDYIGRMRKLEEDFRRGEYLLGETWGRVHDKTFGLFFRDDWSFEIKSAFRRMLMEDDIINFTFFGFRKDRGLVSNIPIKGFQQIPWDCPDNYIGLPWEFRNNLGCYEEYSNAVLVAIRAYQRERREKNKEDAEDVSVSGNN